MDSLLLTREEVAKIHKKYLPSIYYPPFIYPSDKAKLEAQLKKFVEWGEETCNNHKLLVGDRFALHRECSQCWQALEIE